MVLTPVIMKSTILWDVTLYSVVEVYGRFAVNYCLHLQFQKYVKHVLAAVFRVSLAYSSIPQMETFSPKRL
jgi:hypothetical protein